MPPLQDAAPSDRQVGLVRELCSSMPWALWRPDEYQLTRIERWILEFGLTSSRCLRFHFLRDWNSSSSVVYLLIDR